MVNFFNWIFNYILLGTCEMDEVKRLKNSFNNEEHGFSSRASKFYRLINCDLSLSKNNLIYTFCD